MPVPFLSPSRCRCVALALLLLLLLAAGAEAQNRRPLLIEGKQTLFQRVLTRPAAVIRAEPKPDGRVVQGALTPFNVFYVYDRKDAGGQQWLEVGRAADGQTQGWLAAQQTIDWKQTIVVAFGNPAGRERTLMFDSREKLVDLLESELLVPRSHDLRKQALDNALPPDSGVVSIEPDTYIDINQQFYILPILQAELVWLASGFQSQILKVASIPLGADPFNQAPSREDLLRDFNVGIVFVIDTTTSMQPYIDRTRDAVRGILERVSRSDVGERVTFGMIGFRDNIEVAPQLEYLTHTFVPLERGQEPGRVLDELGRMEASVVSSVGFDEDSLAGVQEAITGAPWNDFGGRYIVLVTDAGPRRANDPYSHTKMTPEDVNRLARDNQIAVYTLHLKTPMGAGDHDYARQAYEGLTRFDGRSLYYGVPEGDVREFGRTVDGLADALIGQINETIQGRLSAAEAGQAQAPDPLQSDAALVGLAMQLAYLGRREATRAPDVFEAWVSDRDFDRPTSSALEARLMLTKNQLSTMRDVIKALVDSFEGSLAARMDAGALFAQLRSAVALMTRNPDRVVDAEFRTLGDALGEYLEDLPYTSAVMGVDEAEWAAMGGGRQREMVDFLKSKLRLYEEYHNSPGLWTALYEGSPDGEKVFAMPLDALP